jgi:hypothetical protein
VSDERVRYLSIMSERRIPVLNGERRPVGRLVSRGRYMVRRLMVTLALGTVVVALANLVGRPNGGRRRACRSRRSRDGPRHHLVVRCAGSANSRDTACYANDDTGDRKDHSTGQGETIGCGALAR